MKKVSIIVNKNWEAEPVLAAMCSSEFRPSMLPFPERLQSNRDGKYRAPDVPNPEYSVATARAVFRLHEKNDPQAAVVLEATVWCIQDFMDPTKNSSSSEEKHRFLSTLISSAGPDLVIAVGTAGYMADISYAGCIVIGGRFFIHDGHPRDDENEKSHMRSAEFDKLLPVTFNDEIFSLINPEFKSKVESRFLKVPTNPAVRSACLSSKYYTAIGTVNVTDYSEYVWKDSESIAAFRKVEKRYPIGSLETTHGIIRLNSQAPTIFISAITDREGHFDLEVTPAQNYTASFNAGIVLGQLLCSLQEFVLAGKDFSK
jgi:hypothetical protein